MRTKTSVTAVVVLLSLAVLLTACGSSSSGPDTYSCLNWNSGDSMTYLRTETVSGVPSEITLTYSVNDRTDDLVTIWIRGWIIKDYAIVAGKYIPKSEEVLPQPAENFYGSTTTYTSTTAFCPPPAAGEKYVYTTWLPGPVEGTGGYVTTTLSVTGVSIESISTPAGAFTAKKLVMDKISGINSGTVTRYYVGGIGVVKEVEEIPSENTTTTEELTSYSFQQ